MTSIMPANTKTDMVARHRIVNTPAKRFNGMTPLPDVTFETAPNSNQLQPSI